MRYVYELDYGNGIKSWNFQNYKFTEEQMLKACQESGYPEFNKVKSVRFHCELPRGYHLCSCGNLVKGTNKDELCDECKAIYGHTYEYEL